MRRLIFFPCEGETLLGTLDEAEGATGLLVVSGGNEVRSGTHRGMALLAARLATRGHPVFRFDRRGVGDSTGANRGWLESGPDIRAAATCFRMEAPTLKRLIALGNCDAAAALAAFGRTANIDALILTNPWLDDATDLPPRSAVTARVRYRLRPSSWRRPPSLSGVWNGLRAVVTKRPEPELARLYAASTLPTTVILAQSDRTAQRYATTMRGTFVNIRTASHSFADAADGLEAAVLAALATK